MKKFFIVAVILIIGTMHLNAQVEFTDQLGIGFNIIGYDFSQEDFIPLSFVTDVLLGVHIHNWDTAILAGINVHLGGLDRLDLCVQVDHFLGFSERKSPTGYGISFASGINLIDISDGIIPFARIGGFWHLATMIKIGFALDYRFNGQLSIGVTASLPSITAPFRVVNYQDLYDF